MASKVVIGGHGGWTPSDGYTKVPKGCSIAFYTEFAKSLSGSDAVAISTGAYTGSPSRVIEQFKMCPNMRFYPCSQEEKDLITPHPTDRLLLFTANAAGRPLSHLFESVRHTDEYEFLWACCSALMLFTTGNAPQGLNSTETETGYYIYNYTTGTYEILQAK